MSRFSNSVAVRGSSQLDPSQKNVGISNWPDESFNKQLGGDEMSEKHAWSHSLLDRPNSSHNKCKEQSGKEYPTGNSPRKLRIHYSGTFAASWRKCGGDAQGAREANSTRRP